MRVRDGRFDCLLTVLNYQALRDDAGNIVPARQHRDWMLQNHGVPEPDLIAEREQHSLTAAAAGNSCGKTGFCVDIRWR